MDVISTLISEIERQLNVPLQAVRTFEESEALVLAEVAACFLRRKNSSHLLGVTHMGILAEDPRYHLQLMKTVLKLSHAELLVKVIAWEYRVCKYRGISYEYFPWALKIWRDAVQNHLCPEAASPILGIYTWLINHHVEFVGIADSSVPLLIPMLVGWGVSHKSLLQLILKGDVQGSISLAKSLVSSSDEYRQFCLQVIQPVMYEIGRLWEHGKITATQEHLATAVISRVMLHFYTPYIASNPTKGKAVIASVLNEFHEVGARMVADFLEIDGWYVYYFGSSTPPHELIKTIEEIKPDIVGLSVVMPFNLENAREMVKRIRVSEFHPKIIIGGPLASYMPSIFSEMNPDACGKSAADVLTWANSVWKAKEKNRNGK